MSATEATPACPEPLSYENRELFRSRLIHAAVYHEAEFAQHATQHLMTLAVVGANPTYGDTAPGYCGQYLRQAYEALPVHEGCCEERAAEVLASIREAVARARR